MRRFVNLTILLSIFFSNYSLAELTPAQQQAKLEGITRYNQYKSSEDKLLVAAEAGDEEAQFYLGNAIKNHKQYFTADALRWYTASAEQGNYYAMFQLSRVNTNLCNNMKICRPEATNSSDWFEKLVKTLKHLAEHGDGDAMAVLYNATGKIEWLEKSAQSKSPQGQWMLANIYQDGQGSFFLPGSRARSINDLLKSSSEKGNPKAMMRYFGVLREEKSFSEAQYWLERAAKTGYADAIYNYGYFLAVDPDAIGLKQDLVKGYALISMLKTLDRGGNMKQDVDDTLPEITSQMTQEQIQEGKKAMGEWETTHPPLSFFPDKLAY